MGLDPQETLDFAIFDEKVLNEKLHFFWSV